MNEKNDERDGRGDECEQSFGLGVIACTACGYTLFAECQVRTKVQAVFNALLRRPMRMVLGEYPEGSWVLVCLRCGRAMKKEELLGEAADAGSN